MRSVRAIILPWLTGLVALGALGACGSNDNTRAIEYCIPLEAGSRLPVARVLLGYERFSSTDRPTVADTSRLLVASEIPITVVDGSVMEAGAVELARTSLAVLDANSTEVVGRAIFWDVAALRMILPSLGPAGQSERYDGILGGDLLRKYSVRLVYDKDTTCALPWRDSGFAPPSIKFSAALSDSDEELGADGFAVIDYRLAGGGTAMVDDRELQFGATRVAVGVCVEPDPYWPDAEPVMTVDCTNLEAQLEALIPVTGVDAFGLIATGTQPLVFTESFYEILSGQMGPGWPAGGETATTIDLPEGTVGAAVVQLTRVALVGDRHNNRGPCAELALRRRIDLALRHCPTRVRSEVAKRGASVLEVDTQRFTGSLQASLPAYRIPDSTMMMSGLQAEVSTQIPGIDLLVGAALLRHFEMWIDYPDSRLVMRCMNWVDPLSTADANGDSTGRPVLPCVHATAGETCCAGEAGRECRCEGSPCCQYYRWSAPD
jgi:hypothetical protein